MYTPPTTPWRKLSVVNRFIGVHDTGILLAEANHGSLQAYVHSDNAAMDACLRWKLSLQAAEAVAYLHEQGVIHSDLRPENYLVHATVDPCVDPSPSLDLWLCDFGGSKCEGLGLNGGHLPDDPFFDPRMPWEATPATDIFSLGSIFYTILTGNWPYREGPPPVTVKDKNTYETLVNELFTAGKFTGMDLAVLESIPVRSFQAEVASHRLSNGKVRRERTDSTFRFVQLYFSQCQWQGRHLASASNHLTRTDRARAQRIKTLNISLARWGRIPATKPRLNPQLVSRNIPNQSIQCMHESKRSNSGKGWR